MEINQFSKEVRAILTFFASDKAGDNALCLMEFVQAANLPTKQVADALDWLVAEGILRSSSSYHHSDIGEIVYSFADSDYAQAVYTLAGGKE